MRLIDADELLRLSHRFHISEFDRDGVEIIYADTVRNAPTVEVQKTGKWKLLRKGKETSDYECTNCLGILMDVVNDDTHELQSYCGMCGARMVGEEE